MGGSVVVCGNAESQSVGPATLSTTLKRRVVCWSKVDCVTPEEYMGDVIGDLNSRRGAIVELGERGNVKTIQVMRFC